MRSGSRRAARTALLLLAWTATAPGGARADEPPAVNWETLAYASPAPIHRLRLGLEELFGVSAAFVGYVVQNPPDALPGIVPPYYPWDKLRLLPGTWVFDADDFGTNMVGHAAAGTVYYLIARGNRASIPESFAWTVGASLLWELVEFKEPVSLNDMVMTPVGGLALGEAFSQLSAWFDRGGTDGLSRALAFLFSPAKKLHDWVDRATPDRDPRARGWHEFTVDGGGGVLVQQAAQVAYPVAQVALATRLFRAPSYGEPGRGTFRWGDGNASRVGLGMVFTGSEVVDFLFDTETALLGLYARDVEGEGERRTGHDLLLGGTVGYEYGYHRWDLRTGEVNRIALVRIPGVTLRARWFTAGWTLAAGLDAAVTFGGVQPLALQEPAWLPPGTSVPAVLLASGYYYAIGFRGAPSVEARTGDASIGASMQVDLLTGFTGPNVVATPGQPLRLDDQRWMATAWARWRFPEPGLRVGMAWSWRARSGSADALRASQQERALILDLGVVF